MTYLKCVLAPNYCQCDNISQHRAQLLKKINYTIFPAQTPYCLHAFATPIVKRAKLHPYHQYCMYVSTPKVKYIKQTAITSQDLNYMYQSQNYRVPVFHIYVRCNRHLELLLNSKPSLIHKIFYLYTALKVWLQAAMRILDSYDALKLI